MKALHRLVLVLALALLTGACARSAQRPTLTADAYPGALRSPDDLGPDLMWRQRLTAHWGEDEARSFDVVVQKSSSTLTILGMNPMGQVGFVVTLQGGQVSLENTSGRALPFPARFIVLDVQRTFFPLGPAPDGGSGTTTRTQPGETVQETWRDGHLMERAFRRTDGQPAGAITIQYSGWSPPNQAPERAVLHNAWFGYRLEITTYEQTLLGSLGSGAAAP